jgi:1,4-alpha-glucan branching enzyme
MLNPKKLEMALQAARKQNEAFETSLQNANHSPARPAKPNASVKKTTKKDRSTRSAITPFSNLVKVEFSLEAPHAQSVKLAADFTDWENLALDMVKLTDGDWFATVPLSPGTYSYRFIVDGEWRDDPHAPTREPNPFGTVNAVVKVA